MTNTIAIYLGGFLALAIGADVFGNDAAITLFLTRKFVDLVEWVAFWR